MKMFTFSSISSRRLQRWSPSRRSSSLSSSSLSSSTTTLCIAVIIGLLLHLFQMPLQSLAWSAMDVTTPNLCFLGSSMSKSSLSLSSCTSIRLARTTTRQRFTTTTATTTTRTTTTTSTRLFLSKSNNEKQQESLNNRRSPRSPRSRSHTNRGRSRVDDPFGPTPDLDIDEPELIDPQDVPGLRDLSDPSILPQPILHQPWRRGEMAGCEEPISVSWRRKAEEIIDKAVTLVGGRVLDVTWYLTQVVVTLDDDVKPSPDLLRASGPVIDVISPGPPTYKDPSDPDPDDLTEDDDEDVLYQKYESEEEKQEAVDRRKRSFATKDNDDDPDEPHIADQMTNDDIPLYMEEETRDDIALRVAEEEAQRYFEAEKPMDIESIKIDTAALSIIARAILDALEEVEDELNILGRHELILTSPGASDVLETQRQFDAFRGFEVIVETQDPFQSNRTLRGRLADRNSMDLIINKRGRLVTIPLNFVKCVRLPPVKREKGVPRDAPF